MRILAIGATGFIGRQVVTQLADRGHEVTVLHRGKTALPARDGVSEILGERSSLVALRAEIRRRSPEVCVDLILSSATQARVTLEAVRGIASRVVAISSGDVYRATAVLHRIDKGPVEPVPLTEDAPLRTQSQIYSREELAAVRAGTPWLDEVYDKVEVERAMCSDAELPATILRLPMVYGPGDPHHRLAPLIQTMRNGQTEILLEQEQAKWVPCRGYVEDVARAIALAAALERAAGRVYNVAAREPYTEAEWTAKIGAAAGWKGRVIAMDANRTPPHLILPYRFEQHLFLDSTRIREELGYAECVPEEEGLRRTVEWEIGQA